MRTMTSLLALALTASLAQAAKVDVFPGSGTPLQDAIDAAGDGDSLVVHAGTYAEAVVVTKPLRIRGTPVNSSVVIDPGCSASAALTVASDDVKLQELQVQGGTFFAVDVQNRTRVSISTVQLQDTCGGAEYGINVYQSTRVKLSRNDPYGFEDAGIYIGGIPAQGRVRVTKSTINPGNVRGIIVEDSLPGAVIVDQNRISGPSVSGIFLHNSDGVKVRRNEVQGSFGTGIELDADSDDNQILRNVLSNNATDVVDAGAGNCWRGNDFTTGSVARCP